MLRNGYTLHSSLCLVSPSPIDCVVQFRCVQSDLSLRVGTRLFSVRPRSASTRFRLSRMGLSPHPSFLMWSIDCPGVQSLSPSPFLNDCPHHHLLGCVPGLTWHPIVRSPPILVTFQFLCLKTGPKQGFVVQAVSHFRPSRLWVPMWCEQKTWGALLCRNRRQLVRMFPCTPWFTWDFVSCRSPVSVRRWDSVSNRSPCAQGDGITILHGILWCTCNRISHRAGIPSVFADWNLFGSVLNLKNGWVQHAKILVFLF